MYLRQKITAKYLEKPILVQLCIVTEVQALHDSIQIISPKKTHFCLYSRTRN